MASSSKPLPELVRDSELETRFASRGHTIHIFHDTPITTREEIWKREKRPIGRGAFGEVWLEKCVEGQEPAGPETRAVKVMRLIPQGELSLEVSDYARELETLAKFSQRKYSRCFVKSFGWFKGRDVLCVSLEYLPLGDLRGYLSKKGGRTSQEDAQQIVSQLLDGLKYMHEEGFTHRDLKPANILIKEHPPSGTWWVVLSDFGLSKRVESFVTGSSGLLGTPGYMAPELHGFFVRELEMVADSAADMWCIGVISFQLITGQLPFPDQATLFSYARGESEFPTHKLISSSPEADPKVADFITKLMSPDPSQRPDAPAGLSHPWVAEHRRQAGPSRAFMSTQTGDFAVLELEQSGLAPSTSSSRKSSTSGEDHGDWTFTTTKGKGHEVGNLGLGHTEVLMGSRHDTLLDPHGSSSREHSTNRTNLDLKEQSHTEVEDGSDSNGSSLSSPPPNNIPQQSATSVTSPIHQQQGQSIPYTTQDETIRPSPPRLESATGTEVETNSGPFADDIIELIPGNHGPKVLSHRRFLVTTLDGPSDLTDNGYTAAAFSPIDSQILAALHKNGVDVWNLRTGLIQHRLSRDQGLEHGEVEKEGRRIDQKPRKPRTAQPTVEGDCIVFSNTAGVIACSHWPSPVIHIYSLTTGVHRVLLGHERPISCLAFTSPMAGYGHRLLLASASLDKTVRLWHLHETGTRSKSRESYLLGHRKRVLWAGFITHYSAPNSTLAPSDPPLVFTISTDGQNHLYKSHQEPGLSSSSSSSSREVRKQIRCDKRFPYDDFDDDLTAAAVLANSGTDSCVAVAGLNKNGIPVVRLCYGVDYVSRTGGSWYSLPPGEAIHCISLLGDDGEAPLIILSTQRSTMIWAASASRSRVGMYRIVLHIRKPESLPGPHNIMRFASSSDSLALYSNSTAVHIYDVERIKKFNNLQQHLRRAQLSSFSADRKYLFSVRKAASLTKHISKTPCSIMIWDVERAKPYRFIRFGGHSGTSRPLAISFSNNSTSLGIALEDQIEIYNIKTGQLSQKIALNRGIRDDDADEDFKPIAVLAPDLEGFAFSFVGPATVPSKGNIGISAYFGRKAATSRGQGDSHPPKIDAHNIQRDNPDQAVISLAFSHDGRCLAELTDAGTITVWSSEPEVHMLTRIDASMTQLFARKPVSPSRPGIAFSPDNNRLALFHGHDWGIQAWSLDPQDSTGSGPSTRIFTIPEERPLGIHKPVSEIWAGIESHPSQQMSPDWTRCVTIESNNGWEGVIRLWDISGGGRSGGNSPPISIYERQINLSFVGVRVSFSPDSRLVAVAFLNLGVLEIWDASWLGRNWGLGLRLGK